MQYHHTDGRYILKIERGEAVHETLIHFCQEQQIRNAFVHGIGAVEWVRCGYFDRDERSYEFTEYQDVVEVASYQGNIVQKADGLFIHAHAVCSDKKNQTFGGHIDEMRVGVVFEVILTPLTSTITRTYDETIGLHLMDLT